MKAYPLLVAGALAMLSGDLLAYTIVESRYHVEVAPDKYVDQLILRCEDGRLITVPWQSRLAESCGEDLMGNVTLPPKAAVPPAKAAAPAPIDDQEKQAILTQLRSQYGNISEQQVEFLSGPSGTSTRFKPAIVEVLKRYESCRKVNKDKARCATERDNALARLAEPSPAAAAPATKTPTTSDPVAAAEPARPNPARADAVPAEPMPTEPTLPAAARGEPVAPAAVAPPAPVAPPAAVAPPPPVENRAAAEQKIAEDYTSCMRAKPKFACEQARTKALTALDKPAGKPLKPQRVRKQAAAAMADTAIPETQAAR